MIRIGIIGYSGHFGKVITQRVISDFPDYEFVLLGRKVPAFNNNNIKYLYFDFNIHDSIPAAGGQISIIIDLSGPVKRDDGKSLQIAASSKIPCMDMAIHNSHLSIISKVHDEYPECIALAHFGFFPGISNLIIARGFEMAGEKSGVLINEFPVYAGGGRNVSVSLKDMLEESHNQVNIQHGKKSFFRMHSVKRKFPWNKGRKVFYQWEYSEIPSFIRSDKSISLLQRYFSIKPWILNPLFNIISLLWNSPLHFVLNMIIPFMVYAAKSTIFARFDPSMQMKFLEKSGRRTLIDLNVKSAVSFHGLVMSSFIRAFLSKQIMPGLYTPEQLFTLEEILKPGVHEDYNLTILSQEIDDSAGINKSAGT